ncbi:metal ABC transporter solute-binding protein, Zn/Mn family [Thermopirellula anaerolimosa]
MSFKPSCTAMVSLNPGRGERIVPYGAACKAALSVVLLTTPLFLFFINGCRKTEPGDTSSGVVVAVSLAPQAWLVRRIGGDRVQVEVMISGGSDPHTFQISDADVTRLARSRVFFAAGMPFERTPACQAVLRSGNARVVDLREELIGQGLIAGDHGHADEHEHADSHDHEGHDHEHAHDEPLHVWLSPRLLKAQAETVAKTLEETDPAGGEVYRAGLAAVIAELDSLDKDLRAKLAPLRGQAFFVYHPAWECFAADYDLRQVAIEQSGKEPTDRELSELQQAAAETRIRLILTQPQISSRAAQAVAQTAGLRVETADPLAPDPTAELRRLADLLVSSYRGGSASE